MLVLEEQPQPGGAVRSSELTLPGFTHDLFSAFYPLAAASRVISGLGLSGFGLEWRRSPQVLAHPQADGTSPILSMSLDETAASLDRLAPGDGDRWRDLYASWCATEGQLLDVLLGPFPPVGAALRLIRNAGAGGTFELLRLGLGTVDALTRRVFSGDGARSLLVGNALHTDLTPGDRGSAFFGWLLTCLGQRVGFPVPEGGSGRLTDALVARLEDRGGRISVSSRVTQVIVRNGSAVGVKTEAGGEIEATEAVLADVGAPALYLELVGAEHLSARFLRRLRRFEYDSGTFKVDWALDKPVPWVAEAARSAATLHIADGPEAMRGATEAVARGALPEKPFLVFGQMNVADPTRSPVGTETAWAYTHVPQTVTADEGGRLTGSWQRDEGEVFADRIEEEIERRAPGFRDSILGRHILTPHDMQAMNRNLVNGALNGGTARLSQQVIFRPTLGAAGPRTPIRNLYLASASAHPGGGVHGACGANAAMAVMGARRPT